MSPIMMADFQRAENVYTWNNAYENSPKGSEFAFCRSDWSLERVENTNKIFSCRGLSYQGETLLYRWIFAVCDLESAAQKWNKKPGADQAPRNILIKTDGQTRDAGSQCQPAALARRIKLCGRGECKAADPCLRFSSHRRVICLQNSGRKGWAEVRNKF